MDSEQPKMQALQLTAKSGDQTLREFDLPDGAELVLGASSNADCALTEEPFLSRQHVILRPHGGQLQVERIPSASNPIVFKGSSTDKFTIRPGDYFVIGTTTFHLEGPVALPSRALGQQREYDPSQQFTLGASELRVSADTGDRLRLLDLMQLPEILRTKSRRDFFLYACGGLRIATGARWVQVLTVEDAQPRVLCEDAGVDQLWPRPISQSLIKKAMAEAPKPVTFSWSQDQQADLLATAHEGVDWAVCCAMDIRGEKPMLFYLAGDGSHKPDRQRPFGTELSLRDKARLVGLVADAIGRAVSLQKLEDWQSKLGHFFSGKLVSKILESDDPKQLAPQIRRATVMFFDVRGFSLLTEGNLQRILEYQDDLKRAMTAMTQCIFDYEGVVIRYMGDGILACWNVPYGLANHEEQACLSALRMVHLLGKVSDGWTCGIGLGTGDLVAGSLGSEQVYAYDVLGAVVNQAARVEGITKAVGVPILVTDDIARAVSPKHILTRRVARFLPVGVETEVDLYTIEQTPADTDERRAIEQRHAIHAEALSAFEAGEWESAFELLHPIVKDDIAARYVYTLALQRKPPRDWHGVVEMTSK